MACRSRRGFSLIEVVASIALLSVMMVAVLMAWTRNKEQIERSQQKLIAAELLDQRLGRWFANGNGPPFPSQGRFAGTGFKWKTYRTVNAQRMPAGLLSVTVEVVDRRNRKLLSVEVAGSVRRREGERPVAADPPVRVGEDLP